MSHAEHICLVLVSFGRDRSYFLSGCRMLRKPHTSTAALSRSSAQYWRWFKQRDRSHAQAQTNCCTGARAHVRTTNPMGVQAQGRSLVHRVTISVSDNVLRERTPLATFRCVAIKKPCNRKPFGGNVMVWVFCLTGCLATLAFQALGGGISAPWNGLHSCIFSLILSWLIMILWGSPGRCLSGSSRWGQSRRMNALNVTEEDRLMQKG